LDLDALLALPNILDGQVAPSREYAALTVHRIHPNVDVFLASLDEEGPLTPLTDTPEMTFLLDWAPDSRSVLVSEDKGGNERETIYRVYLDEPGTLHPITESDPDFYLRSGEFGPKGDFLVYAANYDFDEKRELETFRVVVHDLATGDRTTIAAPEKRGSVYPQIGPDGRRVLYNRKDLHPSGTQYWVVNTDGTDDREILNFGPKAKVSASWTFDGRVAFLTDTLDGRLQEAGSIGLLDLGTGTIEWLAKAPEDGRLLERVYCPRPRRHVVMVETRDARERSYVVDLRSGETLDVAPVQGTLTPMGPLDETRWAGVYYSSTHPADLVTFDPRRPEVETFRSVTHVLSMTSVRRDDLTPAEDFRWTGSDGVPLHGWLYRARNPNGKTIVFVHGGPTAHSRDWLNAQIQYFCSLGFHVLDPNYRGSTGYGLTFRDLIKKDGWGGREQEDIRTGIDALIDRGIAQPGRVGITGTSYGGYSSWCAITRYPDVVAAAAPVCGMTDLVVDYETTRPDLRPYSEEMMGGSPDEAPERYRERSPIHFVRNIRGKVLIVQGMQDPNVTPANVREVEGRLQDSGIAYEKLVFEDEGHGIARRGNQKVLYERLAAFFAEAL
jgi:dipeptidyl aminopeptidase/acylaminoacyl peptidase